MDFFQHQEDARKKTGRLVVLFVVAVIAIVVLVYVAVSVAFALGGGHFRSEDVPVRWFRPGLFLGTSAAVVAIVSLASLYKTTSLRGGGRVVAESLGGRLLEPGSVDPQERRLLNVVEEMAIASGIPVPPVFVLDDEAAINAFAAGFSPSDAVIGVTEGCMKRLSRDELQGVVAHEFSHVFNGDMRLNIRLVGVLHGILVIGLIGQYVLRSMRYSGSGRSRSRSGSGKGGGGGLLAILALGAGLAVVGWVGTLFGNMIQAAVSRQREFLADASSVQFTRNPSGITGALKKIGGYAYGSRVRSPGASEVSHMFFGEGLKRGFTAVFATHPPLADRIRRIEPTFDGEFERIAVDFESPYVEGGAYAALAGSPVSRKAAEEADERTTGEREAVAEQATLLQLIGQPSPAHLERARELLDALPAEVRDAAHEPYGARAVVYALLVGEDPTLRTVQLTTLRTRADEGVFAETERLLPLVDAVDPAARLPLVDLALPALRSLSLDQYRTFAGNVEALVLADERLDAFEWALRRVLLAHLAPNFGRGAKPQPVQFYGLQRLADECSLYLSTLAHVGHRDEEAARAAFEAGAARLPRVEPEFLERERCGLGRLGRALERLVHVSAPLKQALLEAGARTVSHDREIEVLEAEVFRATADALGCPVPPLLPGQRLT